MALFTPSESPAVTFKEIDLTAVVRNQQSTTGAMVGNFRWGPVDKIVDIPDEASLARTFGAPDTSTNVDFVSAANFLKYSQDLFVVRGVDSDAINAYDSDAAAAGPTVKFRENFDNQVATLDSAGHTFIARYPGDLGNSLKISMCPYSTSDSAYDNWTYKSSFDAAPGTSTYASNRSASNDEVHVVVIDEDGKFTGTLGTILETYPFVSLGADAKTDDGSTNYVKNVINNRSNYVHLVGFDSDYTVAGAGTNVNASDDYSLVSKVTKTISLKSGVNSGSLSVGQIATAFDLYEDVDNVLVDFLIAPQALTRTDQTSIVNDLISIAESTRKDCIVVTSPAKNDVVNTATPVANAVAGANTFTNSSYLVVDNNFVLVYDKYNDQTLYVPAASSTAGIMAASDRNSAPWFSPAGTRRGKYLGITDLAYSPNKSERDTLYRAGINPIANIPGYGILLYGDKTKLARPSAFDRINVRRLFLVVERAIVDAAKSVIFEFNDEFTRAEFVNIIEPFLREIKGRRGITDFRVVCDETNNTAAVIDRNEFIASIFIKPARSINFITLNFVATRTGADFEEIVGLV